MDITLTGGQSSAVTGLAALCIYGAATDNHTPVQLYGCDGTNAQQWNVISANHSLHSLGKCLDVTGGDTTDGTPVDLYDCNATSAQVWVPQANGELLNPQSENASTTRGSAPHGAPSWKSGTATTDPTRFGKSSPRSDVVI